MVKVESKLLADFSELETRSKLLVSSRQHYVALLDQFLFDGKLPIL